MTAEKLYERSHEKCRDYSADACNSRYLFEVSAACNEHHTAKYYTAHISAHADKLEFAYLPLVRHDERYSIIGGNTQICGNVQ